MLGTELELNKKVCELHLSYNYFFGSGLNAREFFNNDTTQRSNDLC